MSVWVMVGIVMGWMVLVAGFSEWRLRRRLRKLEAQPPYFRGALLLALAHLAKKDRMIPLTELGDLMRRLAECEASSVASALPKTFERGLAWLEEVGYLQRESKADVAYMRASDAFLEWAGIDAHESEEVAPAPVVGFIGSAPPRNAEVDHFYRRVTRLSSKGDPALVIDRDTNRQISNLCGDLSISDRDVTALAVDLLTHLRRHTKSGGQICLFQEGRRPRTLVIDYLKSSRPRAS